MGGLYVNDAPCRQTERPVLWTGWRRCSPRISRRPFHQPDPPCSPKHSMEEERPRQHGHIQRTFILLRNTPTTTDDQCKSYICAEHCSHAVLSPARHGSQPPQRIRRHCTASDGTPRSKRPRSAPDDYFMPMATDSCHSESVQLRLDMFWESEFNRIEFQIEIVI